MEVYCRTELVIVKRRDCKSHYTGQCPWPPNRGDYAKNPGQHSGVLSQKNGFEGDWAMVMEELKQIDPTAYRRFASVCRN
jgi:hypothetical protein